MARFLPGPMANASKAKAVLTLLKQVSRGFDQLNGWAYGKTFAGGTGARVIQGNVASAPEKPEAIDRNFSRSRHWQNVTWHCLAAAESAAR